MTRGCTWTVQQENLALEHMALRGPVPMSALEVSIEIELPLADTERMLAAMVRAEVVEKIPMYHLRPLVRAA